MANHDLVYITETDQRYECRTVEDIEANVSTYVSDRARMDKLGIRVVRGFKVPKSVCDSVYAEVSQFVDAHNAGKNPKLKDLGAKIDSMIASVKPK